MQQQSHATQQNKTAQNIKQQSGRKRKDGAQGERKSARKTCICAALDAADFAAAAAAAQVAALSGNVHLYFIYNKIYFMRKRDNGTKIPAIICITFYS